jgi:hypothetical protein
MNLIDFPTKCDEQPHYRCAGCGCESFVYEVTGYGVQTFYELDDQHRPGVELVENRDTDPWSGLLGPRRYFVRCESCDREIEFGWSHPGRGGRIWPVEASCFNPWLSFPEQRYRKAWRKKGWQRPP